jgi:hypothetical protein
MVSPNRWTADWRNPAEQKRLAAVVYHIRRRALNSAPKYAA